MPKWDLKKVARRRTATNPKTAPKRKRRRNPGFKLPKMRTLFRNTQENLVNAGVGVAGAVGSSMAINALPAMTDQAKGWTTIALGVLAGSMIPKRNKFMQLAATGAIFAGTMKVAKTLMPELPIMAGNDKRIPYYGAPSPVPLQTNDMSGIVDFKLAGEGEEISGTPVSLAGPENFAGTEYFGECLGCDNYGTY